jgi:hypothetical protein
MLLLGLRSMLCCCGVDYNTMRMRMRMGIQLLHSIRLVYVLLTQKGGGGGAPSKSKANQARTARTRHYLQHRHVWLATTIPYGSLSVASVDSRKCMRN